MQSSVTLTRDFRGLNTPGSRAVVKETFRSASGTRAGVLLISEDGACAVLKDYSKSGKGFSFLLSPWLVHREIRALRILGGIEGIPKVLDRMSSRAFLMEYVSSRPLREVQDELNWKQFIQQIEQLVGRIHASGVVHGDLRNASNILVGENGSPVFVDFVSAVFRGYRFNPFSWLLFRLCLRIDHGALFKLKTRHAPELITPQERAHYLTPGLVEKLARWVSARIRSLVQKLSS